MKKLLIPLLFLSVISYGQIQTINIGTTPNDATGDPLRTAMTKINQNFTYTLTQLALKAPAGTTLANYGITDAVSTARTITINGETHNLSSNPTFTVAPNAFEDITGKPTSIAGYGIVDAVPVTRTVNGKNLSANITLATTDIAGLTNVENTSDLNKPISAATQTALDLKADKAVSLSQFAATTSSELAGVISNETGTGNVVLSISPTLTTPALGTPSALVLTNATALPIGGITGLATGVGTWLATSSSANLATAITDETGSGALVFGTSPTLTTPNLGTPSTLVLTNATALPAAAVVVTPAGNIAATNAGAAFNELDTEKASLTGTETLTNKRINPRIQAVTSSATVTPNSDSDDAVKITAQAAGLTLANPSGTPAAMQAIVIRIKDNGTARAITFGSQYRGIVSTLPATTVLSKTMYLGLIWNSDDSKWDMVGLSIEP